MASLKDIMKQSPYMQNAKILIDDEVRQDEDGSYVIHIGYNRVSTEMQAELGYGLEAQEQDILHYAKLKRLENLILFTDDGFTGTNFDRPAIQSVMKLIDAYNTSRSNIRVKSFIVARFDRLGRTLMDARRFIDDYIFDAKSSNSKTNRNKHWIDFFAVEGNFALENGDMSYMLIFNILMSFAEHDRNAIVKKMKDGMLIRVSKGMWPGGGNVPYGYRYNRKTGNLVIVPKQAEKIKEIFRYYIEENKSPQWIADQLGFSSDVVVSQIIRRKSLTGVIQYKGKEYKGNHKAIIDIDTWNAAQDVMKRRSSNRGASDNMLKGLLVCGECGAKMRYQQWNKKSKEQKIVCYSTQKSSKPELVKDPNCKCVRYWATDVEEAVKEEIFAFASYISEDDRKTNVKSISQSILKNKLQEKEKEINNLRKVIRKEDDDEIRADYEADLKELYKERRAIQKEMADEQEYEKRNLKVQKAKNLLRTIEGTWDYMTPKERQIVCNELIEKVVVGNDGVELHLKLSSFLVNNETSEMEV